MEEQEGSAAPGTLVWILNFLLGVTNVEQGRLRLHQQTTVTQRHNGTFMLSAVLGVYVLQDIISTVGLTHAVSFHGGTAHCWWHTHSEWRHFIYIKAFGDTAKIYFVYSGEERSETNRGVQPLDDLA